MKAGLNRVKTSPPPNQTRTAIVLMVGARVLDWDRDGSILPELDLQPACLAGRGRGSELGGIRGKYYIIVINSLAMRVG